MLVVGCCLLVTKDNDEDDNDNDNGDDNDNENDNDLPRNRRRVFSWKKHVPPMLARIPTDKISSVFLMIFGGI